MLLRCSACHSNRGWSGERLGTQYKVSVDLSDLVVDVSWWAFNHVFVQKEVCRSSAVFTALRPSLRITFAIRRQGRQCISLCWITVQVWARDALLVGCRRQRRWDCWRGWRLGPPWIICFLVEVSAGGVCFRQKFEFPVWRQFNW